MFDLYVYQGPDFQTFMGVDPNYTMTAAMTAAQVWLRDGTGRQVRVVNTYDGTIVMTLA